MLRIESLHHVSLPVADLPRAKAFYGGVLGLRELARPAFPFDGAWYAVGASQQLHLILGPHLTFRGPKPLDTTDVHLALRMSTYRSTLDHLRRHGYAEDAADPDRRIRENPNGPSGFPQVFLLDPDGHIIELNADRMD